MTMTSRHVDWLNLGLLFGSAVAAFLLPFEVFLLAYAIVGPLHYLTEIAWLHDRHYFATARRDAIVLAVLAFGVFVTGFLLNWPDKREGIAWGAGLTYAAFLCALAMVVFRDWRAKVTLVILGLAALIEFGRSPAYLLLFAAFLPTLIHVYVFTGLFMLYGALKSRSWPGIASVVALIGCGAALLWWRPASGYEVGAYAAETYPKFAPVNVFLAQLLGEDSQQWDVFRSSAGLAIMRFIAFAYVYHYLNWFSKTAVIRWHRVAIQRPWAILGLWLASVALYFWNYSIGFVALATLSLLHVFLEFPLNVQTVLGIGREARGLIGTTMQPRAERALSRSV